MGDNPINMVFAEANSFVIITRSKLAVGSPP